MRIGKMLEPLFHQHFLLRSLKQYTILFYSTTLYLFFIQMFNLMNEVSDIITNVFLNMLINKKSSISKCAYLSFQKRNDDYWFCSIDRLNGEFTLDNIATCLFGIETNSLQNQNLTLIKYLKKVFDISSQLFFLLIICK